MIKLFTDQLFDVGKKIWDAQYEHPFIRGIQDGTLPLEKFAYWVRQDYLFLIDYGRLFSLAVVKSPNIRSCLQFATLSYETYSTELDLHRSYAKEFGISEFELEIEIKSPTCKAYTDFLLRTGSIGGYHELLGALLPCMWGFYDVGIRLKESILNGNIDVRYLNFIEQYSSNDFRNLVEICKQMVNECASNLTNELRDEMINSFSISCQYEYLFWDMAWKKEIWPVG